MIKINIRWLIQAISLVFGILAFSRAFESSKNLLLEFEMGIAIRVALWIAIFCFCFFVLMFTSYLKQRANATLRNPIALFERLIHKMGIDEYKERKGVSDAKQRKRTRDRLA